MSKTICILGRQPKLSLAELEARFNGAVTACGTSNALIDLPASEVAVHSFGGSIKIAKVLSSATAGWQELLRTYKQQLPDTLAGIPEGKIQLGLSAYDLKLGKGDLWRIGLEIKKAIRAQKRSIRLIPNQDAALNSAQVLHNHLTGSTGIELLLVGDGKTTHLAQTIHVQDIDEYAARDFGRPKRSSFVGMLPPKLAQIMLNLAAVSPGEVVLDPFCGTGVVLQEAALMGCKAHGTDVEPKMIDFSRTNMEWLQQKYRITDIQLGLEQGDAATMQWQQPIDHVVCETYLGQPMTTLPSPEKFSKITEGCNTLIANFLENLQPQLAPGTRCTIAVPAWRVKNGFFHLPVVDQLEKLGYNRISFEQASDQDLIYHRQDQIVARELLVLTRK